MQTPWSLPTSKRIIAVTGHYGSGKTEFAVSLAMLMAESATFRRIAVVDLDIVNPYFRSRERRDLLARNGIELYGSIYKNEITAEIPALGADVRAPLEDADCLSIVDLGGNDAGAKVIRQYGEYFEGDAHELYDVINANRPETAGVDSAIAYMRSIEGASGLKMTGIVNNCHLLTHTTVSTIEKGHALCEAVSQRTGLPIVCDCYPAPIVSAAELAQSKRLGSNPMPLGMYMRESWLDR